MALGVELATSIATPRVVSANGKVTGGASGTRSVPLQIAKPYLGSFSPSSMTVGAPVTMWGSAGGPPIQIEGSNFLPGATLQVSTSSGQVVPCKLQTSNDGTHATFTLPLELLQAPDVLTVEITNDFGGQRSSIQMPYQVLKESFAGAVDRTLYLGDVDVATVPGVRAAHDRRVRGRGPRRCRAGRKRKLRPGGGRG